jgi:hypothetical protein
MCHTIATIFASSRGKSEVTAHVLCLYLKPTTLQAEISSAGDKMSKLKLHLNTVCTAKCSSNCRITVYSQLQVIFTPVGLSYQAESSLSLLAYTDLKRARAYWHFEV